MWLYWCLHTCYWNQKITRAVADDAAKRADEGNKAVIFKNCVPFTESISNVNNSQIENAKI